MVLQAFADAGQRVPNRNAERLQQRRRADARQLQELRRVIGAAGQDHLLARAHVDGFAAAPAFGVAHADGALALEQELGRMRVRAHVDVAALIAVQERGRRAHAPPVVDGALRVGDALLDGAV